MKDNNKWSNIHVITVSEEENSEKNNNRRKFSKFAKNYKSTDL